MHHGCVRSRQRRREAAAGWWPTSPSCRWAGRRTTPRSCHRPRAVPVRPRRVTRSVVRRRRQQPRAGGRSIAGRVPGHVRGPRPTTGELLGRPHGRNGVPAFDVVLRPTKSVSVLYGLGDPATGWAVLAAHQAGLAEAVAYLDEHLAPAAATVASSMRPGGWSSGLSRPRASPSTTRPRTPSMDAGGTRLPSAGWTRTPWSER